jgi:hypothetical protein
MPPGNAQALSIESSGSPEDVRRLLQIMYRLRNQNLREICVSAASHRVGE